jgi:tetratricopeptide (TPR) repeat protein
MVTSERDFHAEYTLRSYAAARDRATQAAGLVEDWVSRETWRQVIEAMRAAETELAVCDDARLDLHTEYLRMMSNNANSHRLGRETWGQAICAACRFRGPDSQTVGRIREYARTVAQEMPPRQWRRIERLMKKRQEHYAFGTPVSAKKIKFILRLAKLYRQAMLGSSASLVLSMLVADLRDDPRQPAMALHAADECLAVGEVGDAQKLYEIYYAAEVAQLTGQVDDDSRYYTSALQHELADCHLLNGEAARAEALIRTALEPFPELRNDSKTRYQAMARSDLYHKCLSLLADCLIAQGRRPAAHAAYQEAHSRFAHIESPTLGAVRTEQSLAHAVIYTGDEWRAYGS